MIKNIQMENNKRKQRSAFLIQMTDLNWLRDWITVDQSQSCTPDLAQAQTQGLDKIIETQYNSTKHWDQGF